MPHTHTYSHTHLHTHTRTHTLRILVAPHTCYVIASNPHQFAYLFSLSPSLSHPQGASPRWEPQIAVLCEAGQIYQPQYLSEEGRWVTDLSKKTTGATCLRDKMDLLDYCKKVSAARDCHCLSYPFARWETLCQSAPPPSSLPCL